MFGRFWRRKARKHIEEGLALYKAHEPDANPHLSVACLDECSPPKPAPGTVTGRAEWKIDLERRAIEVEVDGKKLTLRRGQEVLSSSDSFASLDLRAEDGRIVGVIECHGRAA